jgi:hypothetical protein
VLGKMAFGSFYHVRLGRRFRLTRSFGYTGEGLQWWFNGNADAARVMLVLLCRCIPSKRCWTSAPKARTVGLRRQRFGVTRSAARRVRLGSGLEAARARCPEMHDATRAKSWAVSTPKVRCAAVRGCCKHVKGAPYEVGTRGIACKDVSAVRRHAGGLYDVRSYCYALVKCLKPFVRNGKGVIEADDHAQGSPINSEPFVRKWTHCNEKRAPKAPTSLRLSVC